MTQSANESEMIRRILAGEKDLFHDLIRPYERTVFVMLLSMLKNEADAEDAAQEAILKSFRALGSFREEAKFSTWLTSIALNEGRGRLRKAGSAHFDSLDAEKDTEEGDVTPAQLTDWREVPLEALERRELRATIQDAVEALPFIYREVFTLRDIQELDVRETATLLCTTENVVKVRLHRARIMLQKHLAPVLKSVVPPRRGLLRRLMS